MEFQNDEMRRLVDQFQIEMLGTAVESPWSNRVCERTVGIIKEGLQVKGWENVSRHMMWTVEAKYGLGMREGFLLNQLVFGRNPIRKNTPSVLERRGKVDYLRGTLNVIHKARVAYIQMENEESEVGTET